ncbi:MAG: hypothetical protein GEU77_14800 [Deltaproteobacteria bacterium]|nr:hypothetical protein [Deltaproteobacteria bacterium]
MSAPEILERKFAELLSWEQRKRREQILVTLICYSLLAGLVLLPFYSLLPASDLRWFIPVPFFLLFAPFLFLGRRWRREDSTRALVGVDKALRLDERAVTAWELSERNATEATALLVLREAADRLNTLDPKGLFRRRWRWQHYVAPALLLVWIGLLWFDIDLRFGPDVQPPAQQTLAYKVREFSRALQEKAGGEGLRESLQMGRELEKVAQQGIEAKTADEQFKDELTSMTSKVEAMGKSAGKEPSFATAESRQTLKDLKAELEAAQELLKFPDGVKGERELGQQWLDRLATLPQLQRQFDQQGSGNRSLSQRELKSVLRAMDKQVTGELDRRTLLDAQQFLEQLAKQAAGEKAESNARVAGRGEEDLPGDGKKANSASNLPGSEPGMKKETPPQPAPQFPGGAATHLKGLLGEGNSSGAVLKGKPSSGKNGVSQDEVIATYRRQAEQELNSEQVPDALKETIKNYFLSLGKNE